jgi:hypothetical protein
MCGWCTDRLLSRKLRAAELRSTLDILNHYFFNMPSHVRTQEQEARTQIILLRSRISDSGDDDADPPTEIASIFSDWLVKYLRFVTSFIVLLIAMTVK